MTVSPDNAELSARLPRQRPDKVNILLVDDQPAKLLALSSLLQNPDYNLVTAGSGRDALRVELQRSGRLTERAV